MSVSKLLLCLFSVLFCSVAFSSPRILSEAEVARHNKPTDCYMSFDGKVYDFTAYLPHHDVFMDIRSWCGKDMSSDFRTKAGRGRDHRPGSYAALERFYVADLEPKKESSAEMSGTPEQAAFPVLVPVVATLLAYFLHFFIVKRTGAKKANSWLLQPHSFRVLWNWILLLTCIPAILFGVLLALRPILPFVFVAVPLDFVYWHVEGSLVFSVLCLLHIIRRRKFF